MPVPRVVIDGVVYVTINEAIDITGVSRRTIYNWIQKGKVRTVKLSVAASQRIRLNDLIWKEKTGAGQTPSA